MTRIGVPLRTDLALEAIPGFAYEARPAEDLLWFGPTAVRVLAMPPPFECLAGDDWRARVHADDRDAFAVREQAIAAGEAGYEVEYRVRDGAGDWRIVSDRARRTGEGDRIVYAGMMIDVTEERRLLDRLRFLTIEVDHRVKNALANVTSLTSLAAASEGARSETASVEAFVQRLNDRIHAYARAHALIADSGWDGAYLHDVAEVQIKACGLARVVSVSGPALALRPPAAQAIGLGIHELCQNVLRHRGGGPRSVAIALSWSCGEGGFTLTWKETVADGAPAPSGEEPHGAGPAHEGFGTQILTGMIPMETRGAAELRRDGPDIVYALRCEPADVLARSASPPDPRRVGQRPDDARPRVLVVEDVWTTAMLARDAIAAEGWQVVGPVQTVEAALAELDGDPDAVVFDLMLRDHFALAVVEVMRARGIPFVVTTGYPARAAIPHLEDAPRLQKPYLADELIACLRRLIGD